MSAKSTETISGSLPASPTEPNVQTVETKIQKVVLYSDRAQISRYAKVLLQPGLQIVRVEGLWKGVDRASLQVSLAGEGAPQCVLRSVQFSSIQEIEDVRPQRRALDAELKTKRYELEDADDAVEVAQKRVDAYKALASRMSGDVFGHAKGAAFVYDAAQWGEWGDFLSTATGDATRKLRAAERARKTVREAVEVLEKKLRDLGSQDTKVLTREVAEVELKVTGTVAASILMQVSHIVTNAHWRPSYDLRVDAAAGTMSVSYNAFVQQATGEAWDDVRLELSTARAHVGGEIPEWSGPWFIRKATPVFALSGTRGGARWSTSSAPMMNQMHVARGSAAPSGGMFQDDDEEDGIGGGAPPAFEGVVGNTAAVSDNTTSAAFTIAAPATVAADNEPVKVCIAANIVLPVYFRYSVVPKIDPVVYLKARATNQSPFPFLPGATNIFTDGQLVARSQMDNVAPNEDFWTFLGPDGSVRCTRKSLGKKLNSVSGGFLSGARTRAEYAFTFTCKNSKPAPVELVVWDQLPVSEDKQITVTQIKPDPARAGKTSTEASRPKFSVNNSGYIEWLLKDLRPMEERVFEYEFHVEHPAESHVYEKTDP
jgi:uncharacterized protein (TIGR02231 family)